MVFLQRPTNALNKYQDKEMPGIAKEGDKLQHQMVYYKIRPEVATTKQLINALDKLRPKETQGDSEAQIKRAILCGRDQKPYRMVDIFEGLSDADIASFAWKLTASQEEFIFSYCRQIFNGIGILQGPAGSGKTTIIKVLLEIAIKRGLKVAIVTEANSVADNVIEVIADKGYIAVRMHSMGLERRHLGKRARKDAKHPLLPADPEPDSEPESGNEDDTYVNKYIEKNDETGAESVTSGLSDDADGDGGDDAAETNETVPGDEDADEPDGWQDDELSIIFNDLMLKAAKYNYENAKKIMSPDDPRMKMINAALWTYILEVIGLVPKEKDAPVVNELLQRLSSKAIWKDLRALVVKMQKQELNRAQWTEYGKLVESCGNSLIKDAAHATVCTIAQLAKEWSKNIKFDWIIIDEASKITEAQLVQIWRAATDLLMIIGDHAQLGPTDLSKPRENPFLRQLGFSPYSRLVENGWPYFMLREVMRSTAGLEVLCSDLFYFCQLKPGEGTSLDARPMSLKWQKEIRSRYPTLKPDPEGLVYPIFVNITANSEAEFGGASEIGVASPYAGQVNYDLTILRKVQKDRPDHDWRSLRIGTTEWFMGREAPYMIVDLVRGSNDHGDLGFMLEGRRLNVLLSRQKQALAIFGDKGCVLPLVVGSKDEDEREANRRNTDNRHLIKMLAWVEKNGRRIDVPADSLSQDYVQLDAVSASSGFNPAPEGVLDTSGQTDWDTAPPLTGDANVNDDGAW